MQIKIVFTALVLITTFTAHAIGGNTNDSINKAIKMLEIKVYSKVENKTLYCGASFKGKKITDANGFRTTKPSNKAKKLEWEHVVPAEHFGRSFTEWTKGHEKCIDNRGVKFKGRDCARKRNMTFKYMEADMYNIYPSIGAVNALRSKRRFAEKVQGPGLGDCDIKFEPHHVEPPNSAKGIVARASLYMASVYKEYRLQLRSSDKKLFKSWDKDYPVSKNECQRTKLIGKEQGNINRFVKIPCIRANLWPDK